MTKQPSRPTSNALDTAPGTEPAPAAPRSAGTTHTLRDISIRWKLLALTGLSVVGFGTFGAVALQSLHTVGVNGPVYARIVQSKDLSADVLPPPLYVIESFLLCHEMIAAAESGADGLTLQRLAAHGAALRNEHGARHALWAKALPDDERKQALAEASRLAMAFFRVRDERFVPALLAGRLEEATAVEQAALAPAYRAHRAAIDVVVRLAARSVRREEEDAARAISRTTIALLSVGILLAAISATAGGLFAHAITLRLSTMAGVAENVARGELDPAPLATITVRDEIGTLARAFAVMTRRLRQMLEGLRAKNEELERFTYVVSHDLKSPLVTIKGFVGYLERAVATGNVDAMRADLARVGSAADKMQQLVDDLLELSRVGRAMNPPQRVPLGDLAREAVALVAGRMDERGVDVEISAELPEVEGDRTRLLEVLDNLLENAVKFMGSQPRPRVEIGVRHEGAEDILFVRDNGKGIEPRFHDKIFGLFEKLDPDSEGSGAGLAIVKRVVEAHGGRIWVESKGVGCGSSFCFTLPGRPAAREEV